MGVSSSMSIEDTDQVLVWRQLASLKSMKCREQTNDERGSRQIQIPMPWGGSKVARPNMIGIHWKCLQFSSSMVEGVVRLCWFLLVPVLLELKWFSMLRTSSWVFFNSTRPKISISSRAFQPKTYVAFIVAHAKHIPHTLHRLAISPNPWGHRKNTSLTECFRHSLQLRCILMPTLTLENKTYGPLRAWHVH